MTPPSAAPPGTPSRAERREELVGFACAGCVVLVWSGFVVISRLGMVGSLGPLDVAALRFGTAGLIMLPWLARGGLRRGGAFRGVGLGKALFLAVTAGLGFTLFAFYGFAHAPAAHGAALMSGTLPLQTALLSWLVLREPVGARRAAGLGLIGLGILAMLYDSGDSGSAGQWRGDLCFLGAALCWASFTIAARYWGVQAMQAASLVSVLSAVLFLPPYLLLVDSAIPAAPWSGVLLQAIYQGAFAVVLSIYLFTRAARAIGPSRTAMLTAVMPVCAALLAIPVVGDHPTGIMILGIVLVTAGMMSAVLPANGPLRSAPRRPA